MSRAAITVENLSKAYHIGLKQDRADTLVGAVQGLVTSPLKQLRHMRRMNTFKHRDDGDDIYWALRDVSFEVAEGEVVGIIGRNGAGKSTLLKILSRITEPTSGRATIRGRVSSLLEVGTGFHPELTGRENVYMNGTILGMTRREIDSKFDEIVDFSGVEKFLDTPIKHYSSGMKVRLAFSVAAHLEPEILIIDEVLAVGDAEFQNKCLGKMRDVARGGRTVLFVSHNMAAVGALCTRTLLLNRSEIVRNGAPQEVIDWYEDQVCSNTCTDAADPYQTCRILRGADLLDEAGRRTSKVALGAPLHIAVHFDVNQRVDRPTVGIGIDHTLGSRALTVLTPMSPSAIPSLSGRCTVHCRIPFLPLPPGHYTTKIAISGYDEVSGVLPFVVVNSGGFAEGRGFHRGLCVATSDWWSDNTD